MKFDAINITPLIGTIVDDSYKAEGAVTSVDDDRIEVTGEGFMFTVLRKDVDDRLTFICGPEDDRYFVWNAKGEGYCSFCLDGLLTDEHKLVGADDPCQCENCGIWKGETPEPEVKKQEAKGIISFQAIEVKMLNPTDHNGCRYKATASAGSITRGRDYSKNNADDAFGVALELAESLGWMDNMRLIQGVLKNGNYVHVLEWTK